MVDGVSINKDTIYTFASVVSDRIIEVKFEKDTDQTRSDSKKKKKYFISGVLSDTYFAEYIKNFQNIKDGYLLRTDFGKKIVALYYRISNKMRDIP